MVRFTDMEDLEFVPGASPRAASRSQYAPAMRAAHFQLCPMRAAELADIPEAWSQPPLTFHQLFSC